MDRRGFLAGTAATTALSASGRAYAQTGAAGDAVALGVDFAAAARPLPHFWERAAGSDRFVVGLRDQWRKDLVRVHRDTGIRSVRAHGLFDDEGGIENQGVGKFNFLYVDQIYDFMLDHGVRPFVELSFMPEPLASAGDRMFFYKGNTSPPRRWEDWRDLVQAFADHVVKRYGVAEVGGWKFEVWNEPNIDFWTGTQDDYFELYRQSALGLKAIDRRLQVGGPATAQLAWIPDLIRYCAAKDAPLDFISTHAYPNDPQERIFGEANKYPYEEVIPRGLASVRDQIKASAMPNLPLWLTEWGSHNPAFIVDTVKHCDGLAEAMSYWTFSAVFEEQGPPSLFSDTYGMVDQWGIARPSLHAFTFLHRLGEQRLTASEGPILATRRPDGSAAILVWNLIPARHEGQVANGNPFLANAGGDSAGGADLNLQLQLKGWKGRSPARVAQVNDKVGTALPTWAAMGRPPYPSEAQLETLRQSAELPAPQTLALTQGDAPVLALTVPPNGVALIEIEA